MRPLRRTLCVLSFACALPAVAVADEFSEYRIPEHRVRGWGLSTLGNSTRFSTNRPGLSSRQSSASGDLSGFARWLRDSDPRQWSLSAAAFGSGVRSSNAGDEYDLFPIGSQAAHDTGHDRGVSGGLAIDGSVRFYPGQRPIGFELSARLDANDQQSWSTRTSTTRTNFGSTATRSELQTHGESRVSQESASLNGRVGWGRVRDATPVFAAILLEERLERDHVLSRPLSHEGRQKLAELFATRGDFSTVHDLPEKSFWREVERVLREDGALADSGLDGWSAHHGNEPLVVAISWQRPIGIFVGPIVTARHVHQLERDRNVAGLRHFVDGSLVDESLVDQFQRMSFFFDQTLYGLAAELDRPLGARSQLDLSERAEVDLHGDSDGLSVTGSAAFSHLIAERWFLSAYAGHFRDLRDRPVPQSRWSVYAGAGVTWFLEDFLDLSLGVREEQNHLATPIGPFPLDSRDRLLRVSLAFDVFRGVLDAPGLGLHERPLR